MTYKVKNWKKFQHYKERKPPWIKLHLSLLEDRASMMLSGDAFKFLIQIWLLASEDPLKDGNLPSIDDIAFRLRLEKPKVSKLLQEIASFVLAKPEQLVPSETETETETETENIYSLLKKSFEVVWEDYPNKDGKKEALRHYLASVKTVEDSKSVPVALEKYKAHLAMNSWKKPKNGSTWFNNWRDWVDWVEPDMPEETMSPLQQMIQEAI